ncbi:glycoside hydrolase family 3 C-terminal domain-containing protein [Streptomyces sp. NBC_00193]|uniref:glycoside hydrolase family 3 C-terminal domain-containing protein n=1 Tax=unclassified Streptomyces TaxID=2593676 RepID=UPI00225A6656|nr:MULTISPECIES: glycoside hydrolase family 3 C-terminal domain-containing protein [unclassified Streptomyces]MCX5127698.1 glycoside hydrolase family 3 C-terminal domain-containing protein [Streptomyces sp. NBC_00347]MCX5294879.1 glycoside hydrolase family 3 C-terminal domain-containing protein [Streptomyces sp. NBC_00193]
MGEDMLDRLLEKLDLAQKVRLLSGATTWRTAAEQAVGLREMVTSDGPAGVRGEAWDERLTSALLPSASAIGALWDEDLVEELGGLLASEAVRKGVDVVLAPTLNLHRTPLGGRHFECFSEDPVLTGRTGAALVRGIQAAGVAATAKHYVANDSETGRMHVDVRASERVLREVYLAPFEAAVGAGVWLVMAGYNSVNGATMTASPLLAEPLKGEWGFDGVVVSDWGALRSTLEPALAALDLAMPGPHGPWEASLVRAVQDGHVPERAVDEKVRRLLRLAGRVGALEPHRPPRTPAFGPEDTRTLLRRTVTAGSVLLSNRAVLPLDPSALTEVAVIGVHAASPRLQGGGSAGVFPAHVVTPLDGIRARLEGLARVVHVPGPGLGVPPAPLGADWCSDPRSGRPGVLLRLLDEAGHELYAEHRLSGRQLEPPVMPAARTVEISALLRPQATGEWTFGIAGFGRMSLALGERTVLDGEFPCTTDDPAVVHVNPPLHTVRATLETTEPVLLTARRELVPGAGRATIVAAAAPEPEAAAALAEAVRAARDADAVIVVVGTTEHTETEGHDRADLSLGGHQDELVRAVAAVNRRTIAVVNSGGPVELPWRDEAGAVLLTWFPGQEAGAGLADILFGDAEPGGRLPTTWAAALTDAHVTHAHPVDGRLAYDDGVHIGHRAWLRTGRRPAYWFGHGLGYTTWEYDAVRAPAEVTAGSSFTVRVQVRNAGDRPGREVVQVYLARPESTVERPVRWFAGYAAVHAEAGAPATAVVEVPARALRHWSEAEGAWRTEPGTYRILVGRSAGDLAWSGSLEVQRAT